MFICDVCCKPYSFSDETYLTLNVVDYKFMHTCSSCSGIRSKLELKTSLNVPVWAKTEEEIKFYPSYDSLIDSGDTGGAQYGYYANPGKSIPELIIKYMRGDGTTQEELTSLVQGRDTLYLLWNQVDDYLAHEFKFTSLEDLQEKIKEHVSKENLPQDAPYVVVTEKKDLIDNHIADYYLYCKWSLTLDDLKSSIIHLLDEDLEWGVTKEFLEDEEKRLTSSLSKVKQELSRIKNLSYSLN